MPALGQRADTTKSGIRYHFPYGAVRKIDAHGQAGEVSGAWRSWPSTPGAALNERGLTRRARAGELPLALPAMKMYALTPWKGFPHPPSPDGLGPPSPALRERVPSAARRVRARRVESFSSLMAHAAAGRAERLTRMYGREREACISPVPHQAPGPSPLAVRTGEDGHVPRLIGVSSDHMTAV